MRARTLAVLALALAAAACMSTPRPREVDATSSGALIRLVLDQELVVSLDATGGTGFKWLLQKRADTAALTEVGEPNFTSRVGDQRLVGTSGITTFRFKASALGTETLVFTYRRPWEANLPPAKLVRYDVRVEEPPRFGGARVQ